jgi:hypothetical protein
MARFIGGASVAVVRIEAQGVRRSGRCRHAVHHIHDSTRGGRDLPVSIDRHEMGAVTLDDTANERARGLDRRGIHERDVLPLSRDDADTSMESVDVLLGCLDNGDVVHERGLEARQFTRRGPRRKRVRDGALRALGRSRDADTMYASLARSYRSAQVGGRDMAVIRI